MTWRIVQVPSRTTSYSMQSGHKGAMRELSQLLTLALTLSTSLLATKLSWVRECVPATFKLCRRD